MSPTSNMQPRISIFGVVRRLREQRYCMVQSISQYEFIYEYIIDHLSSEGIIKLQHPRNTFGNDEDMSDQEDHTKKSNAVREFEAGEQMQEKTKLDTNDKQQQNQKKKPGLKLNLQIKIEEDD